MLSTQNTVCVSSTFLRSQYDGKILRKKITKTRVANFSRNFDDGSLSIRLSLSLITLLFKALSLK
ncbi:MAG: hypothetical protein ACI8RD_004524 [Bacillariaceae sp.]|jgi:hypothetical protein